MNSPNVVQLLLAFHLVSISSTHLAARVIAYPKPLGDASNSHYSVTVNEQPVDAVATALQVGYAHFAFTDRVRVDVRVSQPIDSFDLSPHRLGIAAKAVGDRLAFTLDKPCKLHLRINDLPRFFLFADALERKPPSPKDSSVYPVTDFGVTSSSQLIQTHRLQQAIDKVAEKRGTLFVPPGIYRAGTLKLHSNFTLYLAAGAIIKGTARLEDYDRGPGGLAQIHLQDVENVHIFGRGVIDGNGLALRAQFLPDRKPGRAKLIVARRCRDLKIEDIILRDAAVWCVHTIESNDAHFRNLKILSASRAETGADTSHNTDAFDPDNCSNIQIENNFISVDDDAIAVKLVGGVRRDMRNIAFRNNVIWTSCCALKIGTEVYDFTARDILFANNDVIHADTGIAVFCSRGGYVDGARWIGNHFEKVAVAPNNSPHRKSANIYINSRSNDSFGEIRNLTIEQNTFEKNDGGTSAILADGKRGIVDGVVIDELIIDGKTCKTSKAAGIAIDRKVQNATFR